jgi:hypothetical protein
MPSYADEGLEKVAPNIQVQVGSPSQPPPGELPSIDAVPANIFTILDIYSRRTQPIGKDQTKDLIVLTTKPKPPTHFLIKNYADPGTIFLPPPPPLSSSPLPPPPPLLLSSSLPPPPSLLLPPPPRSSKNPIPDLPANLPFDEIKYTPRDLIGVVPNTGSPNYKRYKDKWDPFMKSMYKAFKDTPSAVYIDAINSCISTPYFSPQARRHRNGVLNDGNTTDPENTTYWWQMKHKDEQKEKLTPRTDGAVDVQVQPCDEEIMNHVYLYPVEREKDAGIENGDSLNAFSLIFGIKKGTNDNRSQAAAWSIKITFGFDTVVVELFEGQEELHVSIRRKDPPQKINIKPTVANVLTHGYGDKVYILTFIPVWNGILISYGNPQSSDWGNTVSFVPIDEDLNINTEITNIINPPLQSDYDVRDPNYIPKTVVMRKGKRYKTPGVRIVNSKTGTSLLSRSNTGTGQPSTFSMGNRLSVFYSHCGGALKFVPIYFPQFSRYHFIYPGAASPQDLTTSEYVPVAPPGSPPPPPPLFPPKRKKSKIKEKPINQNVFYVETKSKAITMPVFGFQSGNFVDFRTHLCTIVKDRQAPFACFSMEFKSITPDVRVPIQVWGAIIVDNVIIDEDFVTHAPMNQDGVLSSAAISIPRIRSVNVQRALDGASGTIEWDRFDPVTQTVDPRPYQEVGAIQIQVIGGANTIPGIIFTGIAYGNAEVDNPGENLVQMPLKGRESKINSEGGIGLINVPFFDGYDHRDAMRYMAVYGGFPINTSLATPFKLISSYNINNPVIDFPRGTPVSEAMDTIAKYAGTLYYFDRFGTCIYIDVQKSTGNNWILPDSALETFSDEPDHTWVRNQIIISALVAYPQIGKPLATNFTTTPTQAVMMTVNLDTYPTFAWAKMAVYAIPQIVKDVNEIQRLAVQISKGQSRPRSAARCKIPGNARIELLDTVNSKWLVTSISHQIDLQRKTWSTDLGVELFIPDVQPSVSVSLAPVTSIE